MGLNPGDEVAAAYDEKEEQWFFAKVKSGGFPLRAGTGNSMSLLFNNKALSDKIAESIAYQERSGKCLVGAEPIVENKIEYWPIITASLKNR